MVTTLLELPPAELANRYDGRPMIEATFCQDKQDLGQVKHWQHKWVAQQMVLLLAQLSHHLLVWSQRWLSRVLAIRAKAMRLKSDRRSALGERPPATQ